MPEMDVDEAVRRVGGYKRWHLTVLVVLGTTTFIPIAWQNVSIVFIGWIPPHQCKSFEQDAVYAWPPGENQCTMVNVEVTDNGVPTNVTRPCAHGWVYNTNYHTISTEWDLVCNRNYLAALSQTIFSLVSMAADLSVAYMVDRFGRKKMHVIGGLLLSSLGCGVAFVPSYTFFVIARSILSWASMCVRYSGLTMMMELFDTRRRTVVGVLIQYVWVVLFSLFPLMAYLLTNWRALQFIISLASLLTFLHIWLLPESPIWLVSRKRYPEAERILKKMARWNGVHCNVKLKIPRGTGDSGEYQKSSTSYNVSLLALVKDYILRMHLIIAAFLWVTNVLVYYGITFSTPSLGPDRFLSFFFSAIVEAPVYVILLPILQRCGRKRSLALFHIISGVPLLILASTLYLTGGYMSWINLGLAMVGKFGITGSFAVIIIYSSELFPTGLRCTCLGICGFTATIGSMLAPFTHLAATIWATWFPNTLFGTLSLMSAFVVLLLPETGQSELPESLNDIHKLHRTRSRRLSTGGLSQPRRADMESHADMADSGISQPRHADMGRHADMADKDSPTTYAVSDASTSEQIDVKTTKM